VKQKITNFMVQLAGRHVLYEEVGVEDPVLAWQSIEDIRKLAGELRGQVEERDDKIDLEVIREASRDTAKAIREGRRPTGAPVGVNWFEDALNGYRNAMRPPVERICERHGIELIDRPRIPDYGAGFGDEGVPLPPRR
jgi:hypothetical protein